MRTINTKYSRFLGFTKHYIFLLLIASLFILASCNGSNPPANASQSNLSIADATALESAGAIEFTVSLNATSDSATSFYYRTQDGSATASDYISVTKTTASIAAGNNTTTIRVAIIDDKEVEDAESFVVEILDSSSNSLLDTATGSIEISDLSLSITDATAFEDAGSMKFTVSLSAPFPSNKLVSFNYETTEIAGSASAGADYTSASERATIASGETTTVIFINLIDDSEIEDNETFYLEISSPQPNIPISRARATATIKIDELPSLSITDATAFEDAGSMKFTVSLSEAFPGNIVSFDYRTIDTGSAIAGADYTSVVAGSATIDGGELTTSIMINISDDTLVENDEIFYLEISSPQPNIPITRARATATIKIDDLPSLSITDATAFENAGQIEFTVSLNALFPGSKAVTFNYRTIGDSAVAGTDYTSKAGSATIASGELTTSILINISNDTLVEDDETFYLEISSPQPNIPISRARATGTIKIDELPSLSITDATAFEDAGSIKFRVSLSEAFPGNIVSFDYRTIDDSAIAGTDYTSKAGSATIDGGELTTSILINISNDTLVEDDETFLVEISNPHNATIDISRATATIKISDLSLAIADATALESAGQIEFIVSLNALFPGSKTVSFNYLTISDSAIAGTDYTSKAGSATIDIGELTTSILIDIIDDTRVEDEEFFYLIISENQLDIPIIKPQARGRIKIDDLPSLSIADATAAENAGVLTFRASLSEPFPRSTVVSFDYQTKRGSANNKIAWQQATADAAWSARREHSSVVFDDKIWVLGGWDGSNNKNDVWYSADGINWTRATIAAAWSARYGHSSVVFDGKIWVLGGWDGSNNKNDVWYSTDGINWVEITTTAAWSARREHSSVVFDDKIWVLVGYDGSNNKNDVWYSTDGINWTRATTAAAWSARYVHSSVVFDDKIWVLGGFDGSRKNDVWYSTDGINWTRATIAAAWSARWGHSSVVFDDKIWVLGGYDGGNKNDVWYSTDGINWVEITTTAAWDARRGHSSVVFDGKIWVLGGYDDSNNFNDVYFAYATGDYLKTSSTGAILGGESSTTIDITLLDDDILELADESFDIIISNPINATIDVISGNNQATGTILADAASWSEATTDAAWSARYLHSSVVFGDKIWVLGGFRGGNKNDVWYSADGINWTRATIAAAWSARNRHSSVVFDNKIWVLGGLDGGNKNDVWYSADGINWTRATIAAAWSARNRHSSVVFDNKIWVLGGYDGSGRKNDVWYSTDGINWTRASTNASWSARYYHSSVVFDDKIWVLGGTDGGNKNDVYYSADGINWTRASIAASWTARNAHSSVVFEGKIWVLGGYDGSNNKNDVWHSTNGINWTRATTNATWSARYWHSSVVFDDKIWVLGGFDGSYKNDVWFFGELD